MTIPYDPETPLPADATDEQIDRRAGWLGGYVLGANGAYNRDAIPFRRAKSKSLINEPSTTARVARELQAATVAEYEAKLADAEARLSYIEQLRRERRIWIELRRIDPKSIAFETEGPERWLIGGQGVGDTGKGKTLREAIDAARTPSPEGGT